MDKRNLIFWGVFISMLLSLLYFPAEDGDIWWHIAVGREIANSGEIPSVDDWTYTAVGNPSVYHSWLAELFFYECWLVGGDYGILALKYLFYIGVCLLLWNSLIQFLPKEIACIFVLINAFWLSHQSLSPQVFTFLFSTLLFRWLVLNPEETKKRIIGVAAVLLLWSNLHGGFVIGLTWVLAFVLAGICVKIANKKYKEVPFYLWLSLAALAVTIVNPYGFSLYGIVLKGIHFPTADWQNVKFFPESNLDFVSLFLLIITVSVNFYALFQSRSIHDITYLLFGFLCIAMSLSAVRLTWLLIYPLVVGFYMLFYKDRYENGHVVSPVKEGGDFHNTLNYGLVAAAFIALLLMRIDYKEWLPYRLPLSFFQEVKADSLNGNVFCPLTWSGRVTLMTQGKTKTYIDGRMFLYPNVFFPDYLYLLEKTGLTSKQIDVYSIKYLLLPTTYKDLFIKSTYPIKWKELVFNESAVLLERNQD